MEHNTKPEPVAIASDPTWGGGFSRLAESSRNTLESFCLLESFSFLPCLSPSSRQRLKLTSSPFGWRVRLFVLIAILSFISFHFEVEVHRREWWKQRQPFSSSFQSLLLASLASASVSSLRKECVLTRQNFFSFFSYLDDFYFWSERENEGLSHFRWWMEPLTRISLFPSSSPSLLWLICRSLRSIVNFFPFCCCPHPHPSVNDSFSFSLLFSS